MFLNKNIDLELLPKCFFKLNNLDQTADKKKQ